jgi:ribonuclease HII
MLPARLVPERLEAGCDEAGRGCLAGPVVAAAVILPSDFSHPELNDSKQLSPGKRTQLCELIQQEAVSWSVSFVEPVIIDRVNILNASFQAMTRAVQRLDPLPEHLLIDGNRFRTSLHIPFDCLVKGDARVGSIAAASILAKTFRDFYMAALHQRYPGYGWNENMGYPTAAHRSAIRTLGLTSFHRKSFRQLPEQLELALWA